MRVKLKKLQLAPNTGKYQQQDNVSKKQQENKLGSQNHRRSLFEMPRKNY